MIVTGYEFDDCFIEGLATELKRKMSENVDFFPVEILDFKDSERKQRFVDSFLEGQKKYSDPVEFEKRVKEGESVVLVMRGESGNEWDSNRLLAETYFSLCKLKNDWRAEKLCAVIPYQPFARQHAVYRSGEVWAARHARKLIMNNADFAINVNAHDQKGNKWIDKGFLNIDVAPLITDYFRMLLEKAKDPIIIFPDFCKDRDLQAEVRNALDIGYMIMDKKRDLNTGEISVKLPEHYPNLEGRDLFIPDDMITKGETMYLAIMECKKVGANDAYCAAIHPVNVKGERFNKHGIDLVKSTGASVVISNSIYHPDITLDIRPMIADGIVEEFHYKK
jgi:phosphoribosylpyrophosphate synthetase